MKSAKKERSVLSRSPAIKMAEEVEEVISEVTTKEPKKERKIHKIHANKKVVNREDAQPMSLLFRTLHVDKPIENDMDKFWAKTILSVTIFH